MFDIRLFFRSFQEEIRVAPQVDDHTVAQFGDLRMVQSRYQTDRKWLELKDLVAANVDQMVWVRARIHTSRAKGI